MYSRPVLWFTRRAAKEPLAVALFLLPFLIGFFVRIAVAMISVRFPTFETVSLYPVILSMATAMVPYFNGLLAGLLLLEERDQEILPALRVTPVSDRGILAMKVLPAAILAAFGTPVALLMTGIYTGSSVRVVGLGLLAFFQTIVGTATLLLFARTKVQGMTVGKVMGFGLLAPLVWFLVPSMGRYAALILPAAWFAAGISASQSGILILLGIIYHVFLIGLLEAPARRRYLAITSRM
jgi:ABC-type multidrug transport system permease subunit